MQWKLCQSCLLRSLVAKLDGCIAPTARSTFNGQNVWSYLVCEGGLWAGGNGLDGNTGILESPGTITISTFCCLYCILASNMFLAFSRSKYVNEYWAGEWGTYQCHIALPVHRKYWYRSWKPTLKKIIDWPLSEAIEGQRQRFQVGTRKWFQRSYPDSGTSPAVCLLSNLLRSIVLYFFKSRHSWTWRHWIIHDLFSWNKPFEWMKGSLLSQLLEKHDSNVWDLQ